MKQLKKPLAVILSMLMLMSMFSMLSSAVDNNKIIYYVSDEPDVFLTPHGLDDKALMDRIDFEELRSYLIEQFSTCPDNYVDVSKYNIKYNERTIFWDIIWNNIPELFHMRSAMSYYCDKYDDSGIVQGIKPTEYAYTPEEYASRMELCKKAGDKLLYGIEGNNSLSEMEKALLIHDRLATYCEYAYAEYLADTLDERPNVYNMDGVLVERSAVCNGYALAFTYLARRAGLDSYYCSSDLINHGWNIVYINGVPYHLDVTWDDPTWDQAGRVCHNSFLLSTDAFRVPPSGSNGHNKNGNIDYDETPVATTYDNAFWRSTYCFREAILYIDGTYYYYDTTPTYLSDYAIKSTPAATLLDTSDDEVVLKTYDFANSEIGTSWLYTKLGCDGRNIFFNLSNAIYKYNVKTKQITKFYEPTLNAGESIYSFYYDGRYITMDIATSSNYTGVDYDGRVIVEYPDPETCGVNDHLWKVTTPAQTATCTADGYTAEQTCMACELEISATTIPSQGHDYGDWTTTKTATCTEKGEKQKVCSVCSDVVKESISKVPHVWGWVVDTAETCGTTGLKHEKCANCDATQSLNTVIEATGLHTWEWVIDKNETCGATGLKHEKCKNCDATQSLNTVISATGVHDFEWIIDTAATCGADGIQHEKCKNCDTTRNLNTVISATDNHTWSWVTDKKATCVESGIKHEECSVCHLTQNENTVIPTGGNHDFTSMIISEETKMADASCTVAAQYYYTCAACGTIEGNDDHVFTNGGVKSHEGEWIIKNQPTCGANGRKEFACKNCGAVLGSGEILPATGAHNVVTVAGKAPTCTEKGITAHKVCSDCGTVISEPEITDALGHAYVNGTCTRCGAKCDHMCHADSGFNKLIYRFVLFFWRLFGINKTCKCGYEHF